MNTANKEARRESRTINNIGRLIYSASLITSFDARREILYIADDNQRSLLAEIMVQYEQGLLSPIELTRAIGRLDSLIQLAVTAAQQEEEAAQKEHGKEATKLGTITVLGKYRNARECNDGYLYWLTQWVVVCADGAERHMTADEIINEIGELHTL